MSGTTMMRGGGRGGGGGRECEDARPDVLLVRARVRLNGDAAERQQARAALSALIVDHPDTPEAREAKRLLTIAETPARHRFPSRAASAPAERWRNSKKVSDHDLPALVRAVFDPSAPDDEATAALRQEVVGDIERGLFDAPGDLQTANPAAWEALLSWAVAPLTEIAAFPVHGPTGGRVLSRVREALSAAALQRRKPEIDAALASWDVDRAGKILAEIPHPPETAVSAQWSAATAELDAAAVRRRKTEAAVRAVEAVAAAGRPEAVPAALKAAAALIDDCRDAPPFWADAAGRAAERAREGCAAELRRLIDACDAADALIDACDRLRRLGLPGGDRAMQAALSAVLPAACDRAARAAVARAAAVETPEPLAGVADLLRRAAAALPAGLGADVAGTDVAGADVAGAGEAAAGLSAAADGVRALADAWFAASAGASAAGELGATPDFRALNAASGGVFAPPPGFIAAARRAAALNAELDDMEAALRDPSRRRDHDLCVGRLSTLAADWPGAARVGGMLNEARTIVLAASVETGLAAWDLRPLFDLASARPEPAAIGPARWGRWAARSASPLRRLAEAATAAEGGGVEDLLSRWKRWEAAVDALGAVEEWPAPVFDRVLAFEKESLSALVAAVDRDWLGDKAAGNEAAGDGPALRARAEALAPLTWRPDVEIQRRLLLERSHRIDCAGAVARRDWDAAARALSVLREIAPDADGLEAWSRRIAIGRASDAGAKSFADAVLGDWPKLRKDEGGASLLIAAVERSRPIDDDLTLAKRFIGLSPPLVATPEERKTLEIRREWLGLLVGLNCMEPTLDALEAFVDFKRFRAGDDVRNMTPDFNRLAEIWRAAGDAAGGAAALSCLELLTDRDGPSVRTGADPIETLRRVESRIAAESDAFPTDRTESETGRLEAVASMLRRNRDEIMRRRRILISAGADAASVGSLPDPTSERLERVEILLDAHRRVEALEKTDVRAPAMPIFLRDVRAALVRASGLRPPPALAPVAPVVAGLERRTARVEAACGLNPFWFQFKAAADALADAPAVDPESLIVVETALARVVEIARTTGAAEGAQGAALAKDAFALLRRSTPELNAGAAPVDLAAAAAAVDRLRRAYDEARRTVVQIERLMPLTMFADLRDARYAAFFTAFPAVAPMGRAALGCYVDLVRRAPMPALLTKAPDRFPEWLRLLQPAGV